MSDKVVHVVAGSEEQAKEWMDDPGQIGGPPPIAQDFTNNPFSAATPVDVPEIPIRKVDIVPPTTEEEESILKRLRSKLGLKGGFQHFEELTNDKLKLVEDGSKLVASLLSAVLGLMFTLAGDEYELLAPEEGETFKIIQPFLKIYARHSTLINEISPDYIDASAGIAGVALYAKRVVKTMREIKEMKARGYVYQKPSRTAPAAPEQSSQDRYGSDTGEPEPEQPPERYGFGGEQRTGRGYIITNAGYEPAPGQVEVDVQADGRVDFRGLAPNANGSNANVSGIGAAATFAPQYTDEQQRRQHEALLRLTQRDVQHRIRRAGGI